jgi:uncharacterized protein YcaQ
LSTTAGRKKVTIELKNKNPPINNGQKKNSIAWWQWRQEDHQFESSLGKGSNQTLSQKQNIETKVCKMADC